MHEDFRREHAVKSGSNRALGFVFAAVFLVVGCWPLLGEGPVRVWALLVSGAFLTAALVRPALLAPLNRVWIAFGLLLHRVVSPLLLGTIFFLVVTPIALMMRAFGKDPLRLRLDRSAGSYWIERTPPGPGPDSMRDQF